MIPQSDWDRRLAERAGRSQRAVLAARWEAERVANEARRVGAVDARSVPVPLPVDGGRSVWNNAGRGVALGLSDTGTSLVGAVGTLTGADRLKGWAEEQATLAQDFYDPQGKAGKVGRIGGRLVGEVGTAALGGSLGLKALTKVAPKAAAAIQGGSRLKRTAALTAANAPIDVLQGLESEQGLLLPGRGGSVVENVLLSGVGSALVRAPKASRPVAVGSTASLREVAETIAPSGKADAKVEWLTDADKLRTNVLDRMHPLVVLAEKEGGVKMKEEMEGLVAGIHGARGAAGEWLDAHVKPLLAEIKRAGVLEADVWSLLKARRALAILEAGGGAKAAGVSRDVLKQAVADGELIPAVRAAADRVTALHGDLLKFQFDAGLLSRARYNAIVKSDDFYTPFMVQLSDDLGETGVRTLDRHGVKEMRRKAALRAKTMPPLDALVASAHRTFDDVAKHKVELVMMEIGDAGGSGLIRRLDRPPTGGTAASMTFSKRIGGSNKLAHYEVRDRMLFDAIGGQKPEIFGMTMQLLQFFKQAKHIGVTLLPDFAAANLVRDMGMSGAQRLDWKRSLRETAIGSAVGGAVGATSEDADGWDILRGASFGFGAGAWARPVARTVKATALVLGKGEAYKEFLRSGGSTSGFYVHTAKDAEEAIRALRRTGVKASDIMNPRSWYDALQYIGGTAEQASRLAAFMERKAAGGSLARAAFEAQERTLPFAKQGADPTVRALASTTAFWSPKLKGLDKLARMLKDPKTWGYGVAMFTAPSLALWSLNKDNPEYWDRPQWERSTFWLVPKASGGFYRIPKPFELGYIFASAPEAFADFLARRGYVASAAPKTARSGEVAVDAAKGFGSAFASGLVPVPELISTGAQLALGQDFFRNSPIVSRPDLPAERQVSGRSSGLARALVPLGVAPEKTDFAVQALTGGLGKLASGALDWGLRAGGIGASDAPDPTGPIERLVPNRFKTNPQAITAGTAQALKRKQHLERIATGYNDVRRTGTAAEVESYRQRHETDLKAKFQVEALLNYMDRLHELDRRVSRLQRITPSERREKRAAIKRQSDAVVGMINAR